MTFGLCGRGIRWDDLGEWHWNMYNIIYEMSRQSRFDVRYWMLGAGALGWINMMMLKRKCLKFKNKIKLKKKWIHHGYACVPHPEPCSLLPPHTIPLGHPSAPAPSIQYCALNLDWQLVSYMIFYMFQCHSPIATERIKYLGIYLPKETKDLYIENYKTLVNLIHGYS